MSIYNFSGGILYALIAEAVPLNTNNAEHQYGKTSPINSMTLFDEFVGISGIETHVKQDNYISEFKACKKPGGVGLKKEEFINTFKSNMKNKYDELYCRTHHFINAYLYTDGDKMNQLASRLFFALKLSINIPQDANFQYYKDKTITKDELLRMTNIDLSALILSLWFYVIKNQIDNSRGSELFKYLFVHESDKKTSKYKFNTSLNNYYSGRVQAFTKKPNISIDDCSKLQRINDASDDEIDMVKNEAESIHQENVVESNDTIKVENKGTPAQTINFNFTVNGDNANVRNIVNNGTYIEGDNKDDK